MAAPTTRSRGESAAPRTNASRSGLFVLVILALLLIGGGIFALIFFAGDNPKSDNELLAYLPPDANLIIVIEGDEIVKSDALDRSLGPLPGIDREVFNLMIKVGIMPGDVSHIAIGTREVRRRPWQALGAMQSPAAAIPDGEYASMVFRTKQSVDKAKLVEAWSGREEKKGNKSYYVLAAQNPSISAPNLKCLFPSDTLIVFTRNEKVLDKVLAADPSKSAFSVEMQDMVKRVSRGPIWFAMTRRALPETTYTGIRDSETCPCLTIETAEAIKEMQAIGGSLKVDGERINLTLNMVCTDAGIAARASDKLKNVIEVMRKDHRHPDVKDHPKIVAYKAKNPARIVSPGIWEVCNEVKRTATVGLSGNTIQFSAGFAVDDLKSLLDELLFVRMTIAPGQQKPIAPILPKGGGFPGKLPGKI